MNAIHSGNKMIEELHALYCRLCCKERPLMLDMQREQEWLLWMRRGFTQDDLIAVVRHIRNGIASGKRNQGALKFSNLIVNADFFEEDLAEARALARVPKVNPHKQEVLVATGRREPPSPPAKSVREIIKTSEYQQLVALRKSLEP